MFAALLLCMAPVATDGDTVRCGASRVSVRLFGVQAAELRETGGAASRDALAPRLYGGLRCEPKGASYNRIVATCWNYLGVDVGEAQIRSGHAREDCTYSKNFYGGCSQ